jgi:hypothetical protein
MAMGGSNRMRVFRLYTPGDFAERITPRSSVYQDDQCVARHWLGVEPRGTLQWNLVPRLGAILGVLSNDAHRLRFRMALSACRPHIRLVPNGALALPPLPAGPQCVVFACFSCGDVRMHSLTADGL